MAAKSKAKRKEWKRGYMPTLIDLAVLNILPPEGSRLGLHQIGMTVPGMVERLQKEYGDDTLTSANVSGRMVSMKQHGLVVGVMLIPSQRGLGYQITEAGKKVLADNKDALPEVNKSGNSNR